MNPQAMTTLVLVVYLLGLLFLGFQKGKKPSEFLIASRNVGLWPSVASIVGNLRDGAGLAAWILLTYYYGFGALWLTFGLMTGLLVLGFIAPKLRQLADQHNFISVTEFLNLAIGPKTARISALIIAVTALLYAAAQVYVGGQLIAGLLNLQSWVGIVVVSLVVGLYLIIGGYRSTIITGVVQWLILMLVIILPWFIIGNSFLGQIHFSTLVTIDPLTLIAFFGISFLVTISSADLWQLIFSNRSAKTARASFLISMPMYLVISLGVIFFALAAKTFLSDSIPPDQVLSALFSTSTSYGLALLGVFIAAAVMSTLDSLVFLAASTISREFYSTNLTDEKVTRNHLRKLIMLIMIILAVIAVSIGNIIQYLFSAVTLATILTPIFLIAVWKPRMLEDRDTYIALCLLVAIAIYVLMFSLDLFVILIYTLVPAIVSSILLLGIYLVGDTKNDFPEASPSGK